MDLVLQKLSREATGNKYKPIRDACNSAYGSLETENGVDRPPPQQLREQCLAPLKLALESKNVKLAQHALTGLQKLLADAGLMRVERETEERQLLNQLLDVMKVSPGLNEDQQVEVMKVLLCITCSSAFDINGSAVLKIAEVCIETYTSSCHQRSINTAVRATLSQILGELAQQLRHRQENGISDGRDLREGRPDKGPSVEVLCEDVVLVLTVFCEKLQGTTNNQQLQLLYLECILAVLTSSSPALNLHRGFTDLVWKQLCPLLIVLLGNPVQDKTISSGRGEAEACEPGGVSDRGRGSGCSSSPTGLRSPLPRTVYCCGAELVRLVGSVETLRPVLQSLYHRILLYPPPQHRAEAIRAIKEIVSSPQGLYDLAGPTVPEGETKRRTSQRRKSYLDLLKIVMDGMTEACMKGGMETCLVSVACVCSLLGALEQLSQGKGLNEARTLHLLKHMEELKGGTESNRSSLEITEADFRWQRRLLSAEQSHWDSSQERSPDVSISVTTDTGRTTLEEGGLGHTTPEENPDPHRSRSEYPAPTPDPRAGGAGGKMAPLGAEEGLEPAPPCLGAHPFQDLSNFLSVDRKLPPSRYSESNFSVDEQETSRTEFDSCDQYSMAAEKDSGRSDVSDMGSDNCSLAEEEPGHCHRSLQAAALSLRVLRSQEADQHSARIFVQSLITLLPRLLSLQNPEEVDSSLQSFASTFCSGLQSELLRSPGLDSEDLWSCQALMNADGLYLIAFHTLSLNLKLISCDYYRKKPAPVPVSLKEFVRQAQSSRVLMVLSQAWIEELYHQVLDRNLLGEAGYWGTPEEHCLPLIVMLTDIDGLGSSAVGGQMVSTASEQSPLAQEKNMPDSVTTGVSFARYLLSGCWKNLMDTLSSPLTGRAAGSSRGLAFILGSEGVKEHNQKERDAICLSLDGLRQAARLSCALGVTANCASALAQMSAASCVQEEKEERETPDPSDPIAQVRQKLEQMSRPQGVQLHTAHVLCMDAILSVALEMGSHNPDCWQHVFRVCEYLGALEHMHFSDGSSQPPITITQGQGPGLGPGPGDGAPREPGPQLGSSPIIQSLSIQDLVRESSKAGARGLELRGGGVLSGATAATAIYTLSTMADRLFEDAVKKLNLKALMGFVNQLRKASQAQLFDCVTDSVDYSLAMPGEARSTQGCPSALHLYRLGDVMLRIVRSRSRPLLHLAQTWSVVGPHLSEAACHKERHVSQKAVAFIHDILREVLTDWNELPHFHYNEALFRPFEHIMQLELCDEDVQDQVVTSIGELVEMCSAQIQSGWRPLFSALKTVHSNKSDVKDYLVGDYSMGKSQAPVFDVFEAFLNTDNIQVFANAATDYIMCLMKFVKGLGDEDCREIGDCFPGSASSSTDLCLPALEYLRKCSQLLAKIYKMPSKPFFHGAHMASLHLHPRDTCGGSEDGTETLLSEFDDDTGLIQVWILLLEQLTASISNCPRQHQPPTLELLFLLLREVTKVPGPGFGIFAVTHLLLPVMSLWLQRSRGDQAYWDVAAANFKHAIGLSSELVMEHLHCFIQSDVGYENSINVMLKDLFKLLVSCVAEPTESISRVGCSCIRYVLVTAGPVFTDEMWRLACCALQDAFTVTLEPVKKLLACFQSGAESIGGDACEVRVAAPSLSATAEAEYWRIRAMAQQVFLLDTQCSPKTPNNREGFEHAQSCVLIIELPSEESPNGHSHKSIPFRTLLVSLLSHQVLLQNLSDVLLEESPAWAGPGPGDEVSEAWEQAAGPGSASGPGSGLVEARAAGFLRHISMQNLAMILELLLDSHSTAREFDARPGLKYLLMRVSGVPGAANLYRQAAMSFGLCFRALSRALLAGQEPLSAQGVKHVLSEEERPASDSSQPCSSEDEDIFEETAQVSPPRARERRRRRRGRGRWRAQAGGAPGRGCSQPNSNADWAWLLRRLHQLCSELCSGYVQLHLEAQEAPAWTSVCGTPLPPPPSCQSGGSTPSTGGGLSGRETPVFEEEEEAKASAPSSGPTHERKEVLSRGKEWWEGRVSAMAAERGLGKLVGEYRRRQHRGSGDSGPDSLPGSPLQRPHQLLEPGHPHIHPPALGRAHPSSPSPSPGLPTDHHRPRSGSTTSSHSISLRDNQAQMQAWTNMVLTVMKQIEQLPDQTFTALQPALYPSLSQLSCHVSDPRVRQALRDWLDRVGRIYDIV